MDVIVEIIVFIVRALLGDNKKSKAQGGDPIEKRLAPAREDQAALKRGQVSSAHAPHMTSAAQDPIYDDSGWRRVLVIVALTVLIAMVAIWFTYIRGWLPTG